jgi:hypothetical protein
VWNIYNLIWINNRMGPLIFICNSWSFICDEQICFYLVPSHRWRRNVQIQHQTLTPSYFIYLLWFYPFCFALKWTKNWSWVVGVVDCIVVELQGMFTIHGITDNLSVVYSQYWLSFDAKECFHKHSICFTILHDNHVLRAWVQNIYVGKGKASKELGLGFV